MYINIQEDFLYHVDCEGSLADHNQLIKRKIVIYAKNPSQNENPC